MDTQWLVWGLIIIGVLLLILVYNALVRKYHQVQLSLSSIDAIFKQRHELIPQLVETAKHYMGYERDLIVTVVQMRSRVGNEQSVTSQERAAAERELALATRDLLLASEAYPNLRSSEHFTQLIDALDKVEDNLFATRRAYNASVVDYNTVAALFPICFLARFFSFQPAKLLTIEQSERSVPLLNDLFGGNGNGKKGGRP